MDKKNLSNVRRRNLSFELLRILLMFGIILGHLIQPRMWYAPDEAVRAPFFISHLFQTWTAQVGNWCLSFFLDIFYVILIAIHIKKYLIYGFKYFQ